MDLDLTKDKEILDKWKRQLKFIILNKQQIKILNRYGISNKEEYIKLIETNINDEEAMRKIIELYNINRDIEIEKEKKEEKKRIETLLKESIKYRDDNVKIKMLTEKYEKRAAKLYINFKKIMEEDIDEVEYYVNDFILKNIIFGIFENKKLVGIIIINYSKEFKIDSGEKVKTFYIQELIVDRKYTGKGYGDILIKYCILRCPNDMKYISFMTMPENKAMINIGIKNNFMQQEITSGDPKHSLLFIRINDKIERNLYKLLDYKKSISSSSSPYLSNLSSS
jgi:ribosomal protein S18 acetylase RimI-like enzyme